MTSSSLERLWRSFAKSDVVLRIKQHSVGAKVYERLSIARRSLSSSLYGRRERELFRDVRIYCMFVGHARSGHSIVGALLDAHPNVVLPDEVDVLEYLAAGFNRDQIYRLLLARSQKQARKGRTKGGRDGKVYSYLVPNQWQGRFHRIQVIGHSKAGMSTQRLGKDLGLLQCLQATMKDVEVRLLLTLRNPYDNISTMMLRGNLSFPEAFDRYFSNCATLTAIEQRIDRSALLMVKHEDLILQPEQCLTKICWFLELEAPDDYLRDCASILYASPAKSRAKVQWDTAMIQAVRDGIEQYGFLQGYSYYEH